MDCFLFCTAYVDNSSPNHLPVRYRKWIDYYSRIKDDLGADHIFMFDDASPDLGTDPDLADKISMKESLADQLSEKINTVSFKDHLGRPSRDEYSGWWRSFTYCIEVARKYGFKKIIHIESDFYILSDRLVRFISSLNSGWTSLFCAESDFPETGIQVICEDSFPELEKVYIQAQSSAYKFKRVAEVLLPFTDVVREFNGDRFNWPQMYGWLSGDLELNELDYYGQLPAALKPFSTAELRKVLQDMRSHPAFIEGLDTETFLAIIMDVFKWNNLSLAS